MEVGITKNQIIQELSRSTHGKLSAYVPAGQRAAKEEPEFFAHLIAWNHANGQVRDSKVALPIIGLSVSTFAVLEEFSENSGAHLALLDPRNLCRALDFAREVKTPGMGRKLRDLVTAYLKMREGNYGWFERTTVQHRVSVKTLYAKYHVAPGPIAQDVLFKGKYPKGSTFEAIASLKKMTPLEAAGTVLRRKIPFLVAVGAMGARLKEPDMVMALIEQMSPTELVTNTNMLQKLGIKTNPVLRAAYEAALGRAATSTKATFKTTEAVEAVEDEVLKEKLRGLQERQIKTLGGVDGNWLVLVDRSPSMEKSIKIARHLGSTLAKMVTGKVHVVFFDGGFHSYLDATGKGYDELLAATKSMRAGGSGTSIGSGLKYALDKGIIVDGIAVVSDGGENATPWFHEVYKKYAVAVAKEPPIYFYYVPGQSNDVLTDGVTRAGLDMQKFDLSGGFDYYSLPNIVKTMRTQRYGLIEQIMETPLLKLRDVSGIMLEGFVRKENHATTGTAA